MKGASVRNRALVVGGVVYLLGHEAHELMRDVAPQHASCTPRAQWHCQVVSLPHINHIGPYFIKWQLLRASLHLKVEELSHPDLL